MVIIKPNKAELSYDIECCAVLGNFDGVHTGHRHLIEKARKYAQANGLPLLIYTFENHPKLFYNEDFKVITTCEEKSDLFNELCIDYLYLEDFLQVKDMSPKDFCKNILINKLNAKAVFCGKNHRFGKNAIGSTTDLVENLEKHNTRVFIEDFFYQNNEIVSSSLIRKKIEQGNIPYVNQLLGSCFSVNFPVVHGFCLGRKLGFPTINQVMPKNKLVPPFGVYAGFAHVDGVSYPSVLNVGIKPTITHGQANPPILCETHIIDFDKDLYDKKIKVDFIYKIRDEKRFANIDELKNTVYNDIKKAKIILEKYTDEK